MTVSTENGGGGAVNARAPLLSRVLGAVSALLNAGGSVAIFMLMCLICADVSGRYFFNAPIIGVPEIAEIIIVTVTFLQLPDAMRLGRITRADSILNKIRKTRPGTALSLDLVAYTFGLALMIVILWGAIPEMIKDYQQGYYVGTPGIFTFPSWPVKAMVSLGVALCGLQIIAIAVEQVIGRNQLGEENAS